MKLTKGQLKGVIKECLVEILSEGIGTDVFSDLAKKGTKQGRSKKPSRRQSTPPRRPALDTISYTNVVNESVNVLTEDPVMSAIFADTASTTLQEQLSAESRGGAGPAFSDYASQVASENDPSDLFGDVSENWAAIAFADNSPERK